MNDGSDLKQDILVARGLHKSFGRGLASSHVLRGLDLRVRRGEFLAVMGPSGCGKSTLLHVLGLMTPPDEGVVEIMGRDISRASSGALRKIRRDSIGFVFQRFNLLGTLSGRDNVLLSLKVRSRDAGSGGVDTLLGKMGLAEIARRKPGQMSIGQQQRLAVVRALAHRPEIILADEPTGNLDSENGSALLDLFCQINETQGQTFVMITHSQAAADRAGRVVRMKDGLIE
jgi:putative ABC transport system ATP-binding protein